MRRFNIYTLIVLAFGCLLVLASCKKIEGEGPIITEEKVVAEFSKINFNLKATLVITQGLEQKVEITGHESHLGKIITEVVGNEITIKTKNNIQLRNTEALKVHITVKDMRLLKLNGSGDVIVNSPFIADKLDVMLSGSGTVTFNKLLVNNLMAKISGSGDFKVLDGMANYGEYIISGSGSMDMENMVTKKAEVNISGSGSVRLHVKDQLYVRISGSGNVYYKGEPQIDVDISGSGKLRKLY